MGSSFVGVVKLRFNLDTNTSPPEREKLCDAQDRGDGGPRERGGGYERVGVRH